MSEQIDDGGPAFPAEIDTGNVRLDESLGYNVSIYQPVQGMSLRDYFAAQIIPSLLVIAVGKVGAREIANAAAAAYELADEMLKARKV